MLRLQWEKVSEFTDEYNNLPFYSIKKKLYNNYLSKGIISITSSYKIFIRCYYKNLNVVYSKKQIYTY